MAYPIFPVSPLPAGVNRQFDWHTTINRYDSGARQGFASYLRPLIDFSIPLTNFNEVKQEALMTFVHSVKGTTLPFLMKDPYDYTVNSVLAVPISVTHPSTRYLYDTRSYFVRADTTTIGSLFSSLSGYVRLGVQYDYDQDSGLFTVNTKAALDVWGVRSMQFYRKCAFAQNYNEIARMWNVFNAQLRVEEIV